MSDIVPSRPIFYSGSKADSSVKKNTKKRKKNGKVKVGGKKKKNANKKEQEYREADEDSDVDIDKELMPIGAYINNRDVMLEHVFKSVKEHKLQTLLPDILKNIAIDELREMCCHQLEGMSKKRIRHILSGEEMNSSSGTEESFSDDGKTVDEDKPMEPRTRDTSPDTSTVVHSTCDSQCDGDRSVGSTQDGVNDPIVSTVDDGSADCNAIEIDDCSPIKVEEKIEEDGTEEEKESVTSEEMEEGSEDGEVRSIGQCMESEAGSSKQETQGITSGKSTIEDNLQESGNFNKEGDDDEKGEAGAEPSKNITKEDNCNTNITNQSVESSKPSSELEILELELRARAIRSLMQKVAQNKEHK